MKKILYLEDQEILTKNALKVLKPFNVKLKTTGADAIKYLNGGFKPDIALLDYSIVGEKDLSLKIVEEIRKANKNCRIISITNIGEAFVRVHYPEYVEYFSKMKLISGNTILDFLNK